MLVRKAVPADIPAVTAIYGALLDREERGELSTGWTRGVYPTEQTALDALAAGTLYVLEDGGRVAAAAKLDQNQMAQYSQCTWAARRAAGAGAGAAHTGGGPHCEG